MLQGIFPVIPTLFSDTNHPDLDAQRKVIRFALDAGAHGVVFPGVASEYNFLSPEERGTLLKVLAEEVADSVPVVGGASAPTAQEVIAAGQQAAEYGIHHLMIMAPKGLGKDLELHRNFFREIAEALPGAEIILQNAPDPVGAGLDAASIAGIVKECPAITYVKEETLPSGPAITHLLAGDIPHLKAVFGGGGARYIIDEFDRGAQGAMPAVELTDLHVALFEAHSSRDFARARELYRLSLPLLVSQAIFRMSLTKYVLAKRGITKNLHVRAPLPEMDEYTKKDIDQMLDDLQNCFP